LLAVSPPSRRIRLVLPEIREGRKAAATKRERTAKAHEAEAANIGVSARAGRDNARRKSRGETRALAVPAVPTAAAVVAGIHTTTGAKIRVDAYPSSTNQPHRRPHPRE